MAGELQDMRVVVTGSSRGLGRAFACALASQGARLVINGTNEAALAGTAERIAACGGESTSVVGSVAETEICEQLVDTCVGTYGGIDLLVNNAGIVRDRTLLKMSAQEFDEVIAVNLRGALGRVRSLPRSACAKPKVGTSSKSSPRPDWLADLGKATTPPRRPA